MPLDKLRGFGPWLAFAVPFLFLFTMGYWVVLTDQPARAAVHQLIAVVLPRGQMAPSYGAAVQLWFVLWALIVLAGLVVAIDLERIEHRLINAVLELLEYECLQGPGFDSDLVGADPRQASLRLLGREALRPGAYDPEHFIRRRRSRSRRA